MIHFHKHFFVLVLLLALASALTHAQSQGAGQLVMPLALGALAFQGKNRHLSPAVSRDDIQVNSYESMWANGQAFLQEGRDDENNHDVELPDEDNEDEPAPRIYGRVQGLTINIQGESIVYQRNGQSVTEAGSSLERVMQRYHLQKIEISPASFTLSLYPANHDPESLVNIIIPSIREPVNPACGEWTGVDASLMGFVTYDCMDEIAAIAEAAMRRQSSDDYELTESVKEEKGEYSYVDVLANSSEGYLFTAEWLPQVFPESCMYEERQDNGTAHIELEYGFEGIELYGNTSRKGAWYYEFTHYKKNDGRSDEEDEQTSNDNDDSSSSDSAPDSSGTSHGTSSSESDSESEGEVLRKRRKREIAQTSVEPETAKKKRFTKKVQKRTSVEDKVNQRVFKQEYETKGDFRQEYRRRVWHLKNMKLYEQKKENKDTVLTDAKDKPIKTLWVMDLPSSDFPSEEESDANYELNSSDLESDDGYGTQETLEREAFRAHKLCLQVGLSPGGDPIRFYGYKYFSCIGRKYHSYVVGRPYERSNLLRPDPLLLEKLAEEARSTICNKDD